MGGLLARLKGWLAPAGPVEERRPLPDWSAIDNYVELSRATVDTGWMSEDVFLDGPFRRFLEMCSVDDGSPRGRARALEFGRGAVVGYRSRLVERGGSGEAFDARVWALAHRYFDEGPNGNYMLGVLRGTATHNWGPPADEPADDRPFG